MSEFSEVRTTTHDDGSFIRHAVVIPEKGVSFALVDENGKRVALINAFIYDDSEHVIVDVIDVDKNYNTKKAMAFDEGKRRHMDVSYLVCADFRNNYPEPDGQRVAEGGRIVSTSR